MRLFLLAFVFIIIFVLIAGSLFFGVPSRREAVVVTIAPGEGALVIGRHLKESGVVRNAWAFAFAARVSGVAERLQAGTYIIPPKRSLWEVVDIIRTSAPADEAVVTIVEGSTLRDIARELDSAGLVSEEDFLTAAKISAYRSSFDFLADAPAPSRGSDLLLPAESWSGALAPPAGGGMGPAEATLEGYLFPDTYRFFRKTEADEVIRKMLGRFGEQFDASLRERIHADGRSVFDTVIMASIIEREVRTDPDRAMVADIFWRRLAAGIPLQADSTVNYVTGKKTPGISLEDRDIDSLWNTYRYRGLPKGPIANPGRAALVAAVNPQANQYWYFLTTPEGEAIYSKTNDEHAAAKRKYLR
ncbi:MAG: endolytic transglycosylase MltG [Patescibacteria group bacterium]